MTPLGTHAASPIPALPAARKTAIAAVALAACVWANAVWWGGAIPENGAPDEYEHIATQRFVAEQGRLPTFGEGRFRIHLLDNACHVPVFLTVEDGVASVPADAVIHDDHRFEVRQPYLFTPQLAHLAGGLVARVTGGFRLGKARAVSAAWVAAAALSIFAAVRLLWPGSLATALAGGIMFGFWPQVSFLGAYVNDDAFTLFSTAFLLWACALIESGRTGHRERIALGVALGLLLSSKTYALAALVPTAIWMVRTARTQRTIGIRFFVPSIAIALLPAAAWLAHNAGQFDGDLLGRRTNVTAVERFSAALPPELAERTHLLFLEAPARTGARLGAFPVKWWLRGSLRSFYGTFGWMTLRLPDPVYLVASITLLVTLAAALAERSRRAALALPLLFSFPLFLLLLALSFGNSYVTDLQPQGRYLLPSVAGFSLLAAVGAECLQRRFAVPAQWILGAIAIATNLYARLFVLA